MARETYVLRDGKLVPKAEAKPLVGGAYYMPDITPFETQDGTHIPSRKHLRDYERAYGVRQVGNDIKLPWRES
jgi:hypothetical protein